jgi:hypothetical protein
MNPVDESCWLTDLAMRLAGWQCPSAKACSSGFVVNSAQRFGIEGTL